MADLQGNRAGVREARLADRVAAVTLATAAPPFSPWSRAADATPPSGVALEDLSIGSTKDFISDGRGERTSPSPVTQTGLKISGYRSRTRLSRSPLSAAMQSCGRDSGGHGFRISLEIGDDRVYEPYGQSAR